MRDLTVRLFLYGTLKQGEIMHELVRPWLIDLAPARLPGRLYHLPAGYPALELPPIARLAESTPDPESDARTAGAIAAGRPECPEGWGWVYGEIATLHSPRLCLPPLDEYEDVRSVAECLYQRVLVATECGDRAVTAWTYIMNGGTGGQWLPEGHWPPSQLN